MAGSIVTPTCAVPGCPVQTPRKVCYFHAKTPMEFVCRECGGRARWDGQRISNLAGTKPHDCDLVREWHKRYAA
jgi:hypothetical protein